MPDIVKPYNIALTGENDAEISLYGEVVDHRPVDFWTGEPVAGNFIELDTFLADLEELKGKDNITVHINSIGGDLYAGIAVYNRLKSLAANIVTINDGLAASAGSIIFQAGNTRRVHAGSNIMIHQAAGFLYGYYQSSDLKGVIKQLDAGNKAAVNIYAEASGRDAASLRAALDKESWYTGAEAVEAGLADEVIDDDVQVSMSLAADKSFIMCNGVRLSARGLNTFPAGIPVMPAALASSSAPAPVEDKSENRKETVKELDIKNIDELRAEYPELLAQAESAAKAEGHASGVADERARIQGIEGIQAAIPASMVAEAKYGEKPMDAAALALRAMQAQAAQGASVLAAMTNDAQASGAAAVAAEPNAGPDAGGLPPINTAAEVRKIVDNYKKLMGGKNNG